MFSPRLGFLLALSAVAACGGKIDDGTDSGVDSGIDSPSPPPVCQPPGGSCSVKSDCCSSTCVGGVCGATPPCTPNYVTCSTSSECCSQICDATGYCAPKAPPPPCEPEGAPCGSSSQCCSQWCTGGVCGQPPPPPCKSDGSSCSSGSECCSKVCSAGLCGQFIEVDGGLIPCWSTSNKLCDQCVAQNCCVLQACCQNLLPCGGNDGACSQWLDCVQSCEQKGYSAFWCTQNVCGAPSSSTETSLYSCAQSSCATQCTKD